MFRDLVAGRELAWQLAVRDIRAQYRQTALGYLWIFVIPAANTAVWLLIHSAGIISNTASDISYPVFVLTGTILWSIFMDAVNAPLQQATAAKPMLAKINFPREALIVSGIYQACFNAVIRMIVLLAALMLLGTHLHLSLAFAPLALVGLIITGTTLGVLLTPMGLLYSDVGRSLPLLLQFLMFLSPVVYPMPKNGLAALILQWNPLTPLIVTSRDLIVGNTTNMMGHALVVFGAVTAILFFAWISYRIAMPILIERMSA